MIYSDSEMMSENSSDELMLSKSHVSTTLNKASCILYATLLHAATEKAFCQHLG